MRHWMSAEWTNGLPAWSYTVSTWTTDSWKDISFHRFDSAAYTLDIVVIRACRGKIDGDSDDHPEKG